MARPCVEVLAEAQKFRSSHSRYVQIQAGRFNWETDHRTAAGYLPFIFQRGPQAPGMEIRFRSASSRGTTSSIDMRLDATLCQQLSIIRHATSETSRLSGRGGLAPLNSEHAAATSVISKNGGRPVRTYLE